MVWYSHLFKNFPQFLVIHTVKGFGVVNKAEVDALLELLLWELSFFKLWLMLIGEWEVLFKRFYEL